ncbi:MULTISPECIES: phosphate ABC transporter permease PstA [unclassified Paenibacillus]|uniref:phosphate ABC transporter permease PstA n=1 Tax=unclassified Paenibacillus TaxID=185978 RepID=UPI002405B0F6|nr:MULTISPECIES: phosphate ABC transporter permease PstA [unclassified Paenibacillus]MDF9841191.1 phosphate transport system permease protein [Paenibacillus sp. PastF-2]MDF9847637.1 phosphate transport system permease protein [Paenibacillus sp. PastM-2]MDF9854206.1 phosphate transport system permease protein [Paenibacillus sp. PastF-1]MDH6479623.1 phosphate transport system permease protein [Paenibacillus sp. PastH-2]MDH6505288.1 phosphate transport system permease protein [Paenibacillus sp. P
MKPKTADKIATTLIVFFALLIVAILVGLLGYILVRGLNHISWDFLTSAPQKIRAGGGVGPQLFNSLYLLVLTLLITIPLGLGAGIFMAEYARPGKLTNFIRLIVEVLSSFPSIIVGLFGLLLIVNYFDLGFSLISGAIALTFFNLPLMVRITEQAFRTVPKAQKEAGFALGLSKWKIVTSVLLPVALPTIITGTILSAGRVFGEAAALMFTAGMSSPRLNFSDWNPLHSNSPLNPFRPAETLAVHIWKINSEGLAPDAIQIAAGASAVLVIMVLLFNLLARYFGRFIYRKLTASKRIN